MALSAEIVFGVNLLIWSSSLALAMLADFARLHANQLVCPTVQRRQTFVKGNGVWSHFWGPRSGQRQGTPNEKFAKPWASPTKGGSTTESVTRNFHSLSKENQISLVRNFLSGPSSESKNGRLGGWGWKNDPDFCRLWGGGPGWSGGGVLESKARPWHLGPDQHLGALTRPRASLAFPPRFRHLRESLLSGSKNTHLSSPWKREFLLSCFPFRATEPKHPI